jgi:hypothetical protein
MAVDPASVGALLEETLLARLPGEVDLVFVYGSFVKGNTHRYSDFDISYVPVRESTWDHITVVVDEILCDLYPIHWSRLAGMAEFRDSSGGILQHAKIVYRRNEEAGRRFDALRARQRALLDPSERRTMLGTAQRIFRETGYEYHRLRDNVSANHYPSCRAHAHRILAIVLHALAVANQRFVDTRKLEEVLTLPRLPEGLGEMVGALVRACAPRALQEACEALLQATRTFLLAEQREVFREQTGWAPVGRVYPELKAMLQRVRMACEREDAFDLNNRLIDMYAELGMVLAKATDGAAMSDFNSLAEYEQDLTGWGLPDLLALADARDFAELARQCVSLDERLQRLLVERGAERFEFASMEELRAHLARSLRV